MKKLVTAAAISFFALGSSLALAQTAPMIGKDTSKTGATPPNQAAVRPSRLIQKPRNRLLWQALITSTKQAPLRPTQAPVRPSRLIQKPRNRLPWQALITSTKQAPLRPTQAPVRPSRPRPRPRKSKTKAVLVRLKAPSPRGLLRLLRAHRLTSRPNSRLTMST